MQHDLNMLEVGPVFDATQNNAQLLALLFLAMTYGPGLPLLTPLMFAAFILYFNVDKLLLATYYQKPPQIGNEAIKVVVQYLPIAAMVRLAIAIWMYGNADILPDTVSDEVPGAYQENLNSLKSGWPSIFSTFRDRALRPNTFPLFILLAVIVGFYFVEKFWYQLPFYWIYRFNKILYRVFCTQHIYKTSGTKESLHPFEIQKRNDALRLETAPYTGDYFRYVKHKDEIPHTFYDMCTYNSLTNIDEREVEEGWELADQGDYVIKVKIFSTEMKMPDGTLKEKGTRKKTYEIVGDFQCNSYDVEKVPAYKIAIQGLREGMQSMMEFHNKMKEEHTLEKETEENYEAFVKKRKNSLVYDYEHKGKALRRSFEEQVADESIDQHIDSSIKSIASEMLEKKQGTDKVHPKKSDEEKASELDKVRLKKKNKPQKDPTLASAIARARKNIAVDNASNLEEAVVDNTDDINADNTKLTPLRPTASSDLIQKDSSSSHFTGGKPSANIQKPPQPKKDITFDENGYPTDYYENQEYYDNNYYYNEETGTYEFYDASQYYNYHQ